jgi:hypothetical protein
VQLHPLQSSLNEKVECAFFADERLYKAYPDVINELVRL